MGWKYEVEVWAKADSGDYRYETVRTGQRIIPALLAARRARHLGGCVRVAWRG